MAGHAVRRAAIDARNQIAEALADKLGGSPERFVFADGRVEASEGQIDFSGIREYYIKEHRGYADQPDDDTLTFREAARIAFIERGTIIGRGEYKPPPLGGSYKGAAVGTSPAYGCSAQVVEATVDLDTGMVSVNNATAAHDCGYAINRTQVEAQIQGNFLMGLGEACFEEVKYDELGRVTNPNLAEYKIPTALDVPTITPVVIESNEPAGPYGAKEVGEGGIMPAIPAIMNAVYDATGVRFRELPLNPERVLLALASKRDSGQVHFESDRRCSRIVELLAARRAGS
jgi:4-hydroxybenzoyl-CoA reductase subunit alpha